MRILIDECVDPRVKLLFGEYEASIVHERGWGALEDGPLLKLAEKQYDVFLTIVVARVPKNQIARPDSKLRFGATPPARSYLNRW